MKNRTESQSLASACGVYCGGCPSYKKGTCYGCASQNKTQKRISKWNCKIRKCCLEKNKLTFCYECKDFPCKIRKYLDTRYKNKYKIDLIENSLKIKEIGLEQWLKEQEKKYKCLNCGVTNSPYSDICYNCNYKLK